MQISGFEQTFRYIFRPLFDLNICSVSTKGEQIFRETTKFPRVRRDLLLAIDPALIPELEGVVAHLSRMARSVL